MSNSDEAMMSNSSDSDSVKGKAFKKYKKEKNASSASKNAPVEETLVNEKDKKKTQAKKFQPKKGKLTIQKMTKTIGIMTKRYCLSNFWRITHVYGMCFTAITENGMLKILLTQALQMYLIPTKNL